MTSNTNPNTQPAPLKAVDGLNLSGADINISELAKLLAAVLLQHGHVEEAPANVEDLLDAAHRAVAPQPGAFLFIQEGGSSGEIYAHIFGARADAEFNRLSCGKAGYNTSEVVEMPGLFALQPGVVDVLGLIARVARQLTQVESPKAVAPQTDRLRLNVWATGEGDCDLGGIYNVEFEEIAASQPLAVRAAAALDIFFQSHEEVIERAEKGDDYLVHVVDHLGKVVVPAADVPHEKWARFGTVDLLADDAEDLGDQAGACGASRVI